MSGFGTVAVRYDIDIIGDDETENYKWILVKHYKGSFPLNLFPKISQAYCFMKREFLKTYFFASMYMEKKLPAILDMNAVLIDVDFGYNATEEIQNRIIEGKISKDTANNKDLIYDLFQAYQQHGVVLLDIKGTRQYKNIGTPDLKCKYACIDSIDDVYGLRTSQEWENLYTPSDIESIVSKDFNKYGDGKSYYKYLKEEGVFQFYPQSIEPMSPKELAEFFDMPLLDYLNLEEDLDADGE